MLFHVSIAASYLLVFIDSKFVWQLMEYRDIPCIHGSTEQFKSAYKEVEMARLYQQICFYISFAFVNTIG